MIGVHARKGNAKSIGAGTLSELARELEMAGKENRIEYILEHHEAMMENHDRLLEALDKNAFVYPSAKYSDAGMPESSDTSVTTPDSSVDETGTGTPADAKDKDSLQNLLAQIGEKLSSFENEGLSELLDRLAQCSHEGASLAGLADRLRDLTQDFDFLGAAEVLERMGK